MLHQPIEWYDHYENSKERKVFTFEEHQIPGLRMFGYHSTSHAIAPLPPHYHKDCFEFSYLVQGNLQFSVHEQAYSISGSDMYITFPNEIHDTGNKPMSLHQMYWFQLQANDPRQFLFMDYSSARKITTQLYQLPSPVIKLNSHIDNILSTILSCIAHNTELERIKAGTLIGLLLCIILESADVSNFQVTPDIQRAKDYILQHIHEELYMDELANTALLSVSRFKQKFKEQIGTSPRSFINFHKIEAAKQMLQDGYSVTDTAMELSFSSSNYFSAVFRRYTSLSPTEYIKQLQKSETEDAAVSADTMNTQPL